MSEQLQAGGPESSSSGKRHSACTSCQVLKTKCSRSNTAFGSKCDRCEKLNKQCSLFHPRQQSSTQVCKSFPQDQEMHLGSATPTRRQQQTEVYPSPELPYTIENMNSISTGDMMPSPTMTPVPSKVDHVAAMATSAQSPSTGFDSVSAWQLRIEMRLKTYRAHLQMSFPFITIPQHCTAMTLNTTSPVLMQSIDMVTASLFGSEINNDNSISAFVQQVTNSIFIQGQRSFDLLQGILLVTAWYQPDRCGYSYESSLLSMVLLLVNDLKLVQLVKNGSNFNHHAMKGTDSSQNTKRRVLLGAWYLTSCKTIDNCNLQAMQYSSAINECLEWLEMAQEFVTDATLVHLVKILRLTLRITKFGCQLDGSKNQLGISEMFQHSCIQTYTHELSILQSTIPETGCRALILNYIETANIYLQGRCTDTKMASNTHKESDDYNHEAHVRPIMATRAWFDNWLRIPASLLYCQPATFTSQLPYAFGMLGRAAGQCGSANSLRRDFQLSTMHSSHSVAVNASYYPLYSNQDAQVPPKTCSRLDPRLALNVQGILDTMSIRFHELSDMYESRHPECNSNGNLIHGNPWSPNRLHDLCRTAGLQLWAGMNTENLYPSPPSKEKTIYMPVSDNLAGCQF